MKNKKRININLTKSRRLGRDNSKLIVISSLLTLIVTLTGNYFINVTNHKYSMKETVLALNTESYNFEKEYLLDQILQCKILLYEYNQVFTEIFNLYITTTLMGADVRYKTHEEINTKQGILEDLELKIKDYLVVLNVGQNMVNERYTDEFIKLYRIRNHWFTDIDVIKNFSLVSFYFFESTSYINKLDTLLLDGGEPPINEVGYNKIGIEEIRNEILIDISRYENSILKLDRKNID